MARHVIALSQATDLDASMVGGKAANLARLASHGLRVPDARIVTTEAFDAFMAASGTTPLIRDLSSLPAEAERVAEPAARIRASVLSHPIPPPLAAELAEAFVELSAEGTMVVVRSSATVEDSATSSFAGMLSSIPSVSSAEEMYSAVKRCWASAFGTRAVLYALERRG
ncbi:MAG TPA: PEP/pyruvate-binding domain-containing protein, partial [Coriobacteriia bacterium]|nr:PEP/pyruvate-binding domain-containing protein [Coriobacteriia bacterium]